MNILLLAMNLNWNMFFIYAEHYSAYAVEALSTINLIFMLVMCLTAFLQRKDLTEIVTEGSWKADLLICTGLAVLGLLALYLPNYVRGFGQEFYIFIWIIYGVEIFFMYQYKKFIGKIIAPCWYLTSMTISIVLTSMTFVSMIVFTISVIATTDF